MIFLSQSHFYETRCAAGSICLWNNMRRRQDASYKMRRGPDSFAWILMGSLSCLYNMQFIFYSLQFRILFLSLIKQVMQHNATHCNTLQRSATHCNNLQHCACNMLQHAATHCNALQQRFRTHGAQWGRQMYYRPAKGQLIYLRPAQTVCLFAHRKALSYECIFLMSVKSAFCDGMATTVTAAHNFIWRYLYASMQAAQTPTSKLRFIAPDKESSTNAREHVVERERVWANMQQRSAEEMGSKKGSGWKSTKKIIETLTAAAPEWTLERFAVVEDDFYHKLDRLSVHWQAEKKIKILAALVVCMCEAHDTVI